MTGHCCCQVWTADWDSRAQEQGLLPSRRNDRCRVAFRALPHRLRNVALLSVFGRSLWINGMPLEGRLADIVKYQGCSIIIHSDVTSEGRVLGSYEIFADAPETVAAFAERAITRLRTIVETCDVVGVDPRVLDRDYLVEMAKCEIDFVLEIAF